MVHFAGLDVSVKATSVCVIDDAGKVVLERKIPTEPADIIAVLTSLGVSFGRIGIEAGPLSQWLVNALTAANLPVICVETRHMKALLTAQHVKTLVAQEQRMLLTSRKLLQRKLLDANQQDGPQRCARDRADDAGRPVQAGAPFCTRCCWIRSAATRCAGG